MSKREEARNRGNAEEGPIVLEKRRKSGCGREREG